MTDRSLLPVRSLNSCVLKWPDRQVVDRTVRSWTVEQIKVKPEMIRLGYYGSYARGGWGVGSDLDLIAVVSETVEPKSTEVDSGVQIPTILEIYLGNPPHLGLMFNELAHLFLNAADMYHGWPPESEYVPFAAGPFSLMATGMPANLDPFHRLKYGWLRHRVELRSGRYELQAAVTHGEALVLMDTSRSKKEYFLIENRWNAKDTCDAKLPFDLEVPPRKGEIIGAEGRVQMLRIHAHGTGYGPAGNHLDEDCIIKLDTKPVAAFSIDLSGANAPF